MAEEQTWREIARNTSRKINLGWWLQTLATPLLITSLLIACAILITRRELDMIPWLELSAGTLLVIAITGIFSWLAARPSFETNKQSLVRIEAAMKLRNALTAADHGIAPWPEVPGMINDGVHWHWKRLLPPIAGALLIVTCGFIIPVHAKADNRSEQQEPSAWSDIDTSLDQLDNQEIVQQEYIDEMRKKLEKLREQSQNDWFSHSSLEATDNLKQNHQTEQENLKSNLQRAERSLNALQNQGGKMNAAQKQRLLNEFDQAVKKMQQGGMKPNKKLLEQLKKIDPEQLNQLTPEQMEQLRENMRKHAQGLGQGGKQPGDDKGEGEGDGDGEEEGDGPGRGGINRGPGHAPRPLGKAHGDTGAGKHEGLKSEDQRNALPGDLLGTNDAQHDVDKSKVGPSAGGASSGKGKGGDRVWKNSLLPNEKKALKKFFE
ncbi:MAG: hypothetical protein QNL01_08395 [Akkermansiaceae bacterium]|jgi:hypothetical protein|tara:strand:- start:1299 stop:2597 length:1299 start_codon:yes stop_codon:yes gene_type:complete